MTDIKILDRPLDVTACIDWVSSQNSGAINVFIGTVRNTNKGKNVIRLEFEAYEPMAINEMKKIADEAFLKWPLRKICLHHRTGIVNAEEIAVVIAVSAERRDAAFKACQFVIDQLKQTVPIWKKEIYDDGEQWISAHP